MLSKTEGVYADVVDPLQLRIRTDEGLLFDHGKELSVAEIAFAVGFADPLNFSRFFRKRTGVSPREFRKQYRSKTALKK